MYQFWEGYSKIGWECEFLKRICLTLRSYPPIQIPLHQWFLTSFHKLPWKGFSVSYRDGKSIYSKMMKKQIRKQKVEEVSKCFKICMNMKWVFFFSLEEWLFALAFHYILNVIASCRRWEERGFFRPIRISLVVDVTFLTILFWLLNSICHR